MFKDVAATGEGSRSPFMGFVPNDGEGGPSNEYISEDNNIYFLEENVNIEPNNFGGLENIETEIDNGTRIAKENYQFESETELQLDCLNNWITYVKQ